MLKLMDICKTFNKGTVNEKTALNHLNLEVKDGDFITIIGSNGAGKSTMFNARCGGFYVDEGFVELDGQDITFLPEHKRAKYIGHLFQDPMKGTAPNMTIEENIAIAYLRTSTSQNAFLSRVSRKEKEQFRERLAVLNMGLEDRMKQPVGLLSGGQRQALTLLMATLKKPKLLLLDEHTAALDPKTAAKVLALTEKIVTRDQLTTLMITHNMRDALRYGNRLIMLHNGRVIIDVKGEEKQHLQIADLLDMFEKASGAEMASDRLLLG